MARFDMRRIGPSKIKAVLYPIYSGCRYISATVCLQTACFGLKD